MEHKDYVATLVSRMKYNPQTADEILTMKEFLLAEFLEQDAHLNDLLNKVVEKQLRERMRVEHDRQLDKILDGLGKV